MRACENWVSISWWHVTVLDLLISEAYDGLMIMALPVIMAGTILAHAMWTVRQQLDWTSREKTASNASYQS